jgi:hypothetical protein
MFGFFLIVATHYLIFYGASANADALGFDTLDYNVILLGSSGAVSSMLASIYAPGW